MNTIMQRAGLWVLALTSGAALLSGCATNYRADGPKFWEADYANMVIRYNSDSTIFMLKPDAHEGPFLKILDRQQVCNFAAQRRGGHDMVVVIIGHHRVQAVEDQVKQGWVDSLAKLNYRRVVFLRNREGHDVNGLRVVEDVQLAQVGSRPAQFGRLATAMPEFTMR